MPVTTIKRIFRMSPECLSDIDKKVDAHATEKIIGSCNADNGYITDIEDVHIDSIDICEATSMLKVNVSIESHCVKPKKGNMYSGRVCLIFDMGILLNVAEVLKVLIPIPDNAITVNNQDRSVVYSNAEETLTSIDDIKPSIEIQKNDIVRVEISGIQYNYSTHAYNCFGNIVF